MRRDLEAQVQSRTHLLVDSEKQLLERIEELERMRRQQEIVVDLTSHEIRNPLNAIWQNADLIASVIERLRTKLVGQPIMQLLKDGDDAVQSVSASMKLPLRTDPPSRFSCLSPIRAGSQTTCSTSVN